ncbi:MAG TPA: hypothetical protein VHX65_02835 [Pirellulales bacterium]|jgi:hypothetical protein|nr:hypothetical protein [Pirellulales bacterium]
MIRKALPVAIRQLVLPFLFTSAMLVASASRAGADEPASIPTDANRIVGKWTCQTEGDGVLTVSLTTDGFLGFKFTGGEKDHGYGAYKLRAPDTLLYTAHDETGAQHWTYGFDSAGHLKLTMEQDDPKDAELYTLSRVSP